MGFWLGGKPADKEHPYGHARYEYLAGLAVSVMILVIGIELGKESLGKIIAPTPVEFSWLSAAVLVASILVKLWMSSFNRTIGLHIHSDTLLATAADSRNDVISTAAVLVASIVAHFTHFESPGRHHGSGGGAVHPVQRHRSGAGYPGPHPGVPPPTRNWWSPSDRRRCPTPTCWASMT